MAANEETRRTDTVGAARPKTVGDKPGNEKEGQDPRDSEKKKKGPGAFAPDPPPKLTVPLTPQDLELALTPPIQPRATSHHE